MPESNISVKRRAPTYSRDNAATNFREYCPDFLAAYLTQKRAISGNSARSIVTYFVDLRDFCQYIYFCCRFGLPQEKDQHKEMDIRTMSVDEILDVTPAKIKEYLYFLTDIAGNIESTRRKKLTNIRCFYDYIVDVYTDNTVPNPAASIHKPKIARKLPVYLRENEIEKLLSHIDGENADRDYAMLLLFNVTGIRLSEMSKLNLRDVNMENHTVKIHGKGNKERTVYLTDACEKALVRYLATYREPIEDVLLDPNALFVSSRSKRRLNNRSIEYMVEKRLKEAGLQGMGFSPHKFRHTTATTLAANGEDVLTIQMLLGHESPSTTAIYTHLQSNTVRQAVIRSPLAELGESTPPLPSVESENSSTIIESETP